MLVIVLLPFLLAAAAPWLNARLGRLTAPLLALAPAGMAAYIASHLPLAPGESWTEARLWSSTLGVELAWRLDGLSATFALLISGIGAFILLYAGGYLKGDARLGRLLSHLLLFMGAMLGVVLSDNLFALFVFWELTSFASFLLIGFKHEDRASRDAALQALLVTGSGGLAMLAGLILLAIAGAQAGLPAMEAARISALQTVDLRAHAMYSPAVLLILVGAFTKSAQVPFHFWLPSAMTAPTPVSAYLHSATMVKAGVYLLARLSPALGDTPLWNGALIIVGGATMLIAAFLSVGQTDLKRILAYTTVSVLGTLTMLIGIGTDLALKAMVVYLVAHAAYKAALFLVAGSIDHETGTRDVRELGGLLRKMPISATAAALAALSMAGAPPMFGFIGKELLLTAKLELVNPVGSLPAIGPYLLLVAVATNILLVAMALVVAGWPFFGSKRETPKAPHEAPASMWIGPMVLALIGIFVGIAPGPFERSIGTATASAIGGRTIDMHLALWHGVNPVALTALGISALSIVLGFALFVRLRAWLAHGVALVRWLGTHGPAALYERSLAALNTGALRLTRTIQTGRLRDYLAAILVVFVVLLARPLSQIDYRDDVIGLPALPHELLIVGVAIGTAVLAMASRSRLGSIASLGVTGLMIALLFALFSAPDLAMTQVMVETLTVILLVFVFYHLPSFSSLRSRLTRVAHGVIAVTGGATMALLLLASAAVEQPDNLGMFYAANARPEANGRNVVNVILVDFRAVDTLGEATVVALAGLGVHALLRFRRRTRAAGAPAPSRTEPKRGGLASQPLPGGPTWDR